MSEHNDFNDFGDHHNNEENHHHHSEEQHQHHDDFHSEVRPSAPAAHDDNGYIVVPPTPQTSIDSGVESHNTLKNDEISRMLEEIQNTTETKLNSLNTVIAEADSSTGPAPVERSHQPTSTQEKEKACEKQCESSGNPLCPYYLLACDKLTKVQVPPRVRDLLLWSCPKKTGAVFGSILVLLISLATFSLFTVIGSLMLVASTVIGAYRFYLMLQFRIKGTYDDTFDKLSAFDLSLPKEKVEKLVQLLESDVNRALNKLKAIILWDNICNSAIAFTGFYFVYCLGSWFNTLTLLILIHVSVFTLPKVYQVYKKPIDQCIEKATAVAHQTCNQVMAKLPPFLQGKKKAQ